MYVGLLSGFYDFLHRYSSGVVAISDILCDRFIEKYWFLTDHTKLRSQIAQRNRRDVTPVHSHGTRNRIVQSLQQLDAGGFATTTLAYQGDHLARFHD